jgi:hypothetical protein
MVLEMCRKYIYIISNYKKNKKKNRNTTEELDGNDWPWSSTSSLASNCQDDCGLPWTFMTSDHGLQGRPDLHSLGDHSCDDVVFDLQIPKA